MRLPARFLGGKHEFIKTWSFGVWSIACWDFFHGVTLFGMGWFVLVRGLGILRPIDTFILLHSTSPFTPPCGKQPYLPRPHTQSTCPGNIEMVSHKCCTPRMDTLHPWTNIFIRGGGAFASGWTYCDTRAQIRATGAGAPPGFNHTATYSIPSAERTEYQLKCRISHSASSRGIE